MKPSLRDFLYFSKAQRRGIVVLLSLILVLYAIRTYFADHLNRTDDDQLFYFAQLIEQEVESSSEVKEVESSEFENRIELFPFDPNQIGKKEWIALGFSENQAQSILNYRAKGGKFRVRSDLSKMYVISKKKYQELESYITLPESIPSIKEEHSIIPPKEVIIRVIELNTADSIDLVSLRGVGPVYASRILKYRKLLGGFYDTDQLKEVWGLRDSTILLIQPYITVDPSTVMTLDINQADAKSLSAHPYIDWNMAKAMVNYREQHGRYTSLEELNKIYLLNDSLVRRIFPHLAVDKKDQ